MGIGISQAFSLRQTQPGAALHLHLGATWFPAWRRQLVSYPLEAAGISQASRLETLLRRRHRRRRRRLEPLPLSFLHCPTLCR